MYNFKPMRGFTLIETAVAVAVFGLIAAAAFGFMRAEAEAKRKNETIEKIEFIKGALAQHIQSYGDLPCPARRSPAPKSTGFGVERAQDVNANGVLEDDESCVGLAIGGTPALRVLYGFDKGSDGNTVDDKVIVGTIPTRTLNIPDSYMWDGWGRRFTYAVTASQTAGSLDESEGRITVLDANGNVATSLSNPAGTPNSLPVFVIVSHGENGRGAYNLEGDPPAVSCGTASATSARDVFNCDADAIFMTAEFSKATAGPAFFDDIIDYSVFVSSLAGNFCHRNLSFYNPTHPDADENGCVKRGVLLTRWDYFTLPCTQAGPGPNTLLAPFAPSAGIPNSNCATVAFRNTGASGIYDDPSDGVLNGGVTIFSQMVRAGVKGTLRVRATIPVTYENRWGSGLWEDPILGIVLIDGNLVGVNQIVDPYKGIGTIANPTLMGSTPGPGKGGSTGTVIGTLPVVAGRDYNVEIKIVSTGNNSAGSIRGWAGTLIFGNYYARGVVEIIEHSD